LPGFSKEVAMSKRMFPILLLAIYGCSEKDWLIAPSAPQHYLEVSAPVISVSRPGVFKPFLSVQSVDTVVTTKFIVSSENNPQVVAWALGPLTYKRVFDYTWDVWESKYISCPYPDRKLEAEFGSECQIHGHRFLSGTFAFKKSGAIGVVVVASWDSAPTKYSMVMLR
jgi:hypothetical protein